MALLFRACRSMSRPSSPTSEVIALRERRWQKPHATYATRVTLGTLDHSPRQMRRPCRPHCARGLEHESARRAHARILQPRGAEAAWLLQLEAPSARPPRDCPRPIPALITLQ